jgi:glycosyltransferase involved in cell wall biosynthesis
MTTPGKSPVVSVVIPTYNRAHILGRSLGSVLAQTFQDFEVIVVDDGSTDNSEEIVRSFSDARVRYLRHESNKGGSAARNTGIRAAKGQYVAFQDSDDEWLPEKLAIQLEAFKTSKLEHLGVVTCPLFGAHDGKLDETPRSKGNSKDGWVYKDLLTRRFVVGVGTPTLLVRRDAITEANLFDESLPRDEDWDFVLRLSRDWQVQSVDAPLMIVHYRSGSSVSQSTDTRTLEAAEWIISKYYNELAAEPGVLARHYYRLAWLCFRSGAMAKCRQSVRDALHHRHNQRFLRLRLLYGLTLVPSNVLPNTRRAVAMMNLHPGSRRY